MSKENLVPLIRQAQQGDKEALIALYLRFERMIEHISKDYRGIINEDCQQELVIEFLKLVEKFNLDYYDKHKKSKE